jgi:F-type H+-transporting ATPase subunit epsilon
MPIPVEIVTPEKVVSHADVDSIVVPAADGELGILPHHAPLLAQLQPGQIKLRIGDATELFSVSGGFVEVKAERVTIFAVTAELAEEIDA